MSTTNLTKFPLCWPVGWKRSAGWREGRFSSKSGSGCARPLSIAEATRRLTDELTRMGVSEQNVVISTNLQLRLDGLPKSGQPQPADPAVAVYWRKGKETKCMAIDLYSRVEQNLAAVAATLDAMRAIERHGGAAVMDRAFDGFAALPEKSTAKTWMFVMNLAANSTPPVIEAKFKEMAMTRHPDRGGSNEEWQELQDARQQALAANS